MEMSSKKPVNHSKDGVQVKKKVKYFMWTIKPCYIKTHRVQQIYFEVFVVKKSLCSAVKGS